MSEYFPEPKSLGGRVKLEFELDLSNYETKLDLKNAAGAMHQNLLKRLI